MKIKKVTTTTTMFKDLLTIFEVDRNAFLRRHDNKIHRDLEIYRSIVVAAVLAVAYETRVQGRTFFRTPRPEIRVFY